MNEQNVLKDQGGDMISRTREYYNYLKYKAQSTHGMSKPMTEKEKKDLELWETIYHYEEISRLKAEIGQLKARLRELESK